MGLFTNNESYNEYEVPVVEGYAGIDGRVAIMMEAYADDMNFFKELISNDVAELNAMSEGADLEILAENAVTSAFAKLKELIKKVWAKVKALFQAFIARVTGFVTKDGKAYDKKYRALALKNIGEGRCKKIKYKVRKVKTVSDDKALSAILTGIPAAADALDFDSNPVTDIIADKMDNTEVKEYFIKNSFKINSPDAKTFKKDLIDEYYDDEEEEEGITAPQIAEASNILTGNSGTVKKLNEKQKQIENKFKELLRKCDSMEKDMDSRLRAKKDDKVVDHQTFKRKLSGDNVKRGEDNEETSKYGEDIKKVTAMRTALTCFQEVTNTAIGATSEMVSLQFKQARKVMALAASAAGRKKVNESYEDEMALDFILDEEAAFAVDAFMA